MAFDSKEYTRLRDIAQKRIKRGQAAGYGLDGVKVPTVKELRQRGEYAQQIEMMRLQQFLQTGFSLERRRQASRETLTEEQRRERRREQSRDYRRRKKTYDYEPAKGKKYREYLKGVKTMGVDIPPSQLPAFFAYMDYRFAQGAGSKKYVFDIFVDDFKTMIRKGYNPEQILGDFQKFEAEQAEIASRAGSMEGMTAEKAVGLWDEFVNK